MYLKDILEHVSKRKDFENISKTYHGAEAEHREYQKHIKNVSWGRTPPRKSVQQISETYLKRIMGSRRNSESIRNISKYISKTYQKHIMESRWNSESIKNISTHIKQISKTYHSGGARPGRVSRVYHKHIQNK